MRPLKVFFSREINPPRLSSCCNAFCVQCAGVTVSSTLPARAPSASSGLLALETRPSQFMTVAFCPRSLPVSSCGQGEGLGVTLHEHGDGVDRARAHHPNPERPGFFFFGEGASLAAGFTSATSRGASLALCARPHA